MGRGGLGIVLIFLGFLLIFLALLGRVTPTLAVLTAPVKGPQIFTLASQGQKGA